MSIRILCGGPISEDYNVFVAHIHSLLKQGYELDYKGIDNSPHPLDKPHGFRCVEWKREESLGEYKQNNLRFCHELLQKMGQWREEMRLSAIAGGYDFLFMVDSDLILGENTLNLMLEAKKDYIAGLVWTLVRPGRKHLWPNCWNVCDSKPTEHIGHIRRLPGKLYRSDYNEDFRQKLKSGGIHEVGLTGACCLISKKILPVINYSPYIGSVGDDEWLTVSALNAKIPLYIHADVKIEHRRRR
jgi:hypothetical protein